MIALYFVDGSVERIAGGTYESVGADGKLRERHRANRRDLNRIRELQRLTAQKKRQAGVAGFALVNSQQAALQITDAAGWVEELRGTRYILRDPNGNTVVSRTATDKDLSRLKVLVGQF